MNPTIPKDQLEISTELVASMVGDFEAAAPDPQFKSAFALGCLSVHAARWHAELQELRQLILKLTNAEKGKLIQ